MIPYKPDIDMGTLTPRNIHGPEVRKSAVTLSGLLNVLDGVGSEEGKLFFATASHLHSPYFQPHPEFFYIFFFGVDNRRITSTSWIRHY